MSAKSADYLKAARDSARQQHIIPEWLPEHLLLFWSAEDAQLLRALVEGEAEDQWQIGKYAVLCVVRNRVRHPKWWGHDYHTVCLWPQQFSCFWADFSVRRKALMRGYDDRCAEDTRWAVAELLGGGADLTDGADHYFAARIPRPEWADNMVRKLQIGSHIFYQALGV